MTRLSDRLRGILKPPSVAAGQGSGRLCVERSLPVSAADSLTRFGQELEKIKRNIQRALDHYQATDKDASDGVDCDGG